MPTGRPSAPPGSGGPGPDAPLVEILAYVRRQLAAGDRAVAIDVADPDLGAGQHAGARLPAPYEGWIHRPLRVWVDLASRLSLRLNTPRPGRAPGLMRLTFERLATPAPQPPGPERYGEGSAFSRVHKAEDPSFILDLSDALARTGLGDAPSILDLGCGDGSELALIRTLRPAWRDANVVGIDHSPSAVARARERFGDARVHLVEADLAELASLDLRPTRFDLVVSIATMHSPGVDDRELLRHLVKDRITERAALIFGFPNCRYRDGEVLYGARMRNFGQPELSLLVKDVAHYRRYLQKHRRKVYVTGQHYLFVTAVPLDAPNAPGTAGE